MRWFRSALIACAFAASLPAFQPAANKAWGAAGFSEAPANLPGPVAAVWHSVRFVRIGQVGGTLTYLGHLASGRETLGYYLTAAHVACLFGAPMPADRFEIYRDEPGSSGKIDGRVLRVSCEPTHDLAILEVAEANSDGQLRPIAIAPEHLYPWSAYAVGFPGVANGKRVWSLGHKLCPVTHEIFIWGTQIRLWVHDVPLEHGSSGGPLLNDRGELLGINVAIGSFVVSEKERSGCSDRREDAMPSVTVRVDQRMIDALLGQGLGVTGLHP